MSFSKHVLIASLVLALPLSACGSNKADDSNSADTTFPMPSYVEAGASELGEVVSYSSDSLGVAFDYYGEYPLGETVVMEEGNPIVLQNYDCGDAKGCYEGFPTFKIEIFPDVSEQLDARVSDLAEHFGSVDYGNNVYEYGYLAGSTPGTAYIIETVGVHQINIYDNPPAEFVELLLSSFEAL